MHTCDLFLLLLFFKSVYTFMVVCVSIYVLANCRRHAFLFALGNEDNCNTVFLAITKRRRFSPTLSSPPISGFSLFQRTILFKNCFVQEGGLSPTAGKLEEINMKAQDFVLIICPVDFIFDLPFDHSTCVSDG